jgi:hypothetical protein
VDFIPGVIDVGFVRYLGYSTGAGNHVGHPACRPSGW